VYCDVVPIATVKAIGDVGMNVTRDVMHVDEGAVVLHVTVMGAAKPAIGDAVAVVCAVSPAMTSPEVGLSANVKSTPLPVI
jgi:hypothetical protein